MGEHQAIKSTLLFLLINVQSTRGITWSRGTIRGPSDRARFKSALCHRQVECVPNTSELPSSSVQRRVANRQLAQPYYFYSKNECFPLKGFSGDTVQSPSHPCGKEIMGRSARFSAVCLVTALVFLLAPSGAHSADCVFTTNTYGQPTVFN